MKRPIKRQSHRKANKISPSSRAPEGSYLGNSSGSWDKGFDNNQSSFNESASTSVPRFDSSTLSSKIKFKRRGIDIPGNRLFKSAMKSVDPLSNVRRNKRIPIAECVKGKGKEVAQDSIDLTIDEDDDEEEEEEEEEEEDLILQYSEPSPGQQSNYTSPNFYNRKKLSNRAPEDDDADPMNLKPRKTNSVIDSMRRRDNTLGREDQKQDVTYTRQLGIRKNDSISLRWIGMSESPEQFYKISGKCALVINPSSIIITNHDNRKTIKFKVQTNYVRHIHMPHLESNNSKFIIMLQDNFFEYIRKQDFWREVKETSNAIKSPISALFFQGEVHSKSEIGRFLSFWQSAWTSPKISWSYMQEGELDVYTIKCELDSFMDSDQNDVNLPCKRTSSRTSQSRTSEHNSILKTSVPISTYNHKNKNASQNVYENFKYNNRSKFSKSDCSSYFRQSLLNPTGEMEAISKRQSLSPEAESDLGKKITKTKDFQAELRPSVRKSSCLSWVNNAAKDFKEKPQAILTFPETDDHADSDTALVWPSNDETAFNSVAIYYGDLKRLKDGEFLNDTLIEFGLKWELKQLQEKNPPLAESIHLFNSFFYQKLSTKSKQKITASDEARLAYDGVRKWTKGLDVFKKKYLIIPINEHLHWYFMIVLNPGKLLDQNMLPTTPARPNPTIYQPRSLRSQKFNNSEIEGPKMTPNSKVRDFDTNQKSRFFVQSSVELLDGVEGEARGFVADHHISDDTPTTALQQMDIDDQEDGNIISEARCSDKDFFEDSPIFLTLDSLGNPHRPQSQLVIRYLINEAQDKLNTNLPESILKSINVRKVNVPAQPNYCDCGLYLIHAFKRFFENPQKMVEWILDPTKNKKKTNEKEVEDTWDAAGASKARKALRETIHNLIPAYQKKEKERKAQRLKKVPQNDQDSDLSSVPDSINMDLPLDKDEVEEFMHSPLHDAGGGFSVVRSGSLSPGYRSHILKRKVDKCESFKTHEKPCAFEHIKSLPPEQKKKDDSVINIPDSPIQKGKRCLSGAGCEEMGHVYSRDQQRLLEDSVISQPPRSLKEHDSSIYSPNSIHSRKASQSPVIDHNNEVGTPPYDPPVESSTSPKTKILTFDESASITMSDSLAAAATSKRKSNARDGNVIGMSNKAHEVDGKRQKFSNSLKKYNEGFEKNLSNSDDHHGRTLNLSSNSNDCSLSKNRCQFQGNQHLEKIGSYSERKLLQSKDEGIGNHFIDPQKKVAIKGKHTSASEQNGGLRATTDLTSGGQDNPYTVED